MNREEIRAIHERTPFSPFTIHLADGRSFDVPHPEFMWIPPLWKRTVIVVNERGIIHHVHLPSITSIGTLDDVA